MSSSCCSQCSNNGDNSSTCPGSKGFMLFGVRVTTDGYSIRKSASMNNLSQFDQQPDHRSDLAAGYASDDVVLASAGTRDRKRGVPWTEEEHRLFLIGLQKMGKGDWRGISRNFVKSRTPTQVASHAQKYFLRRNNLNRRRRRSSLFDLTTDTFLSMPVDQEISVAENPNCNLGFQVPILFPGGETENQPLRQDKAPAPKIVKPIPVIPAMVRDLNQRSGMKSSSLSLKLLEQRHTAFQAMSSSVNNGDLDSNSSMICVA